MELKGSRTEGNLWAAYAGEAKARLKYSYYAEQARRDGYQQIGDIFDETSANENQHAKIWYKLATGGIPRTPQALEDGAGGEHYEWASMYPDFARVAREEGFTEIARLFDEVAKIEKGHETRYQALIQNVENKQVFERPEQQSWICRNCGHVHQGPDAPQVCPVCGYGQGFFEIKANNY